MQLMESQKTCVQSIFNCTSKMRDINLSDVNEIMRNNLLIKLYLNALLL